MNVLFVEITSGKRWQTEQLLFGVIKCSLPLPPFFYFGVILSIWNLHFKHKWDGLIFALFSNNACLHSWLHLCLLNTFLTNPQHGHSEVIWNTIGSFFLSKQQNHTNKFIFFHTNNSPLALVCTWDFVQVSMTKPLMEVIFFFLSFFFISVFDWLLLHIADVVISQQQETPWVTLKDVLCSH